MGRPPSRDRRDPRAEAYLHPLRQKILEDCPERRARRARSPQNRRRDNARQGQVAIIKDDSAQKLGHWPTFLLE